MYPYQTKVIPTKRLVARSKIFGIYKVGFQINDVSFWPFKKGEIIDNKKMPENGVKIKRGDKPSELRFDSYYTKEKLEQLFNENNKNS